MHRTIDINYLKENNLILFEVVSGSRAYGLATPDSDTDIKGVYYLPKSIFYSNEYVDQVSNETNDIVYYEIGKYILLLTKNNPNILEMLLTPHEHILFKHPYMDMLLPELFLSKLAKETFAGYALTQIKKAKGLNKKINNPVEQVRKSVLDFCYIIAGVMSFNLKEWLEGTGRKQEFAGLVKLNHAKGLYAFFYDETGMYRGIVKNIESNDVCCSEVEKGVEPLAYLLFNKDAYSLHCKTYKEYQEWVGKRNQIRFSGNQKHGKGYDAKNMMHTIRLLHQARELLETGSFSVHRPNRDELLQIKNGDRSYEELLVYTDHLMNAIEFAERSSTLPDTPDHVKAERILISIRERLYG